jgi:zinc protease
MMKLRFSVLALSATLLWCTFPAVSQTTATTAPTSTRFLNPAAISQRTLPNGVRAVIQENPGADLVSVQVWVRAGGRYETKANNGVTHLIESIAVESATNNPGGKFAPNTAIEKLGGQLGSLTARDSLFYSATVASRFLPQALRVLSAMTLSPDLSDDNIEAAKESLLSELLLPGDPIREASDLAYATAFSKHPYQNSPQGSSTALLTLDGNKVRSYHKARFAGSNISVVIGGDLTRDHAHKLIAQYFGSAPKASTTPEIAAEKPLAEVARASRRGSLPVSVLTLAFRSPGIKDTNNVIAADVLLAHWKEGRDAAMGKVLRTISPQASADEEEENAPPPPPADSDDENTPLAYGFDVDYLTQQDNGLFLIALAAPTNRTNATNAVLEEITRVQNDGLSDAELTRAKNLLRQQYLRQGETLSGQVGSLGFYDVIDNYRFAIDYLDRIERITNDDIKRFAKTYLTPQAHVQATIEGIRPPVEKPNSGVITARLF